VVTTRRRAASAASRCGSAARLPLTEAAAAMRLAESGTAAGKVVLQPRR
jgi:hypothetical protein